jgi:23S rRNA (cytidine2498-2'-O)-methyltransferase
MDSSETIILNSPTSSVWICTANRGYGKFAAEELRRLFEVVRIEFLSPGDVFRIDIALPKETALKRIMHNEPIFLRHIQPADYAVTTTRDLEVLGEMLHIYLEDDFQSYLTKDTRVAVQIRVQETMQGEFHTPVKLKNRIDEWIDNHPRTTSVVKDMDVVISAYVSQMKIFWGISKPSENLSSWSGGAIHYRKLATDISRAKYKLMEAEDVFCINFNRFQNALDIGAAPGGWSSLLLERGVQVVAVDPAEMDRSLMQRQGFRHIRKNAAELKFNSAEFDLLVCDMSWNPIQMANLLIHIFPAIHRGGTIITTIKLIHGKPFVTLKTVKNIFSSSLRLIKAKQLFHNREELTCYWIKAVE